MSVRIGAALRRELPAVGDLAAHEPAMAGVASEELRLRTPSLPAGASAGHRPSRRPSSAAPSRPNARALGSLRAVAERLGQPGALASLGEAAGPVAGMLGAVGELLAARDAVAAQRRAEARG